MRHTSPVNLISTVRGSAVEHFVLVPFFTQLRGFSVAFKMYDLDNDDMISKEELLAILHMMVGANISEDQLVSIAERTILESDDDKDQMISFEEFCKALSRTDVAQKMSIRFLS